MTADETEGCRGVLPSFRVGHLGIWLWACLALSGCAWLQDFALPKTPGEQSTGYGYIPVDALPVEPTLRNQSCTPWFQQVRNQAGNTLHMYYMFKPPYEGMDPYQSLSESLPDVNVRFAVASFNQSLGFNYGPAKLTEKGNSYRAVLDYVNVDAIPVTMEIVATIRNAPVRLSDAVKAAEAPHGETVSFTATTVDEDSGSTNAVGKLVTIPVYVGIGLRLSADVRALTGGVALTSLDAIGANAQADKLTGTLTVQTIGIAGPAVNTALPLPSTLDQTTVENAILSIGSIRATVFTSANDSNIVYTPQVVGIYSPIGSSPALINAIYAELSRDPPKWDRPCVPLSSKTSQSEQQTDQVGQGTGATGGKLTGKDTGKAASNAATGKAPTGKTAAEETRKNTTGGATGKATGKAKSKPPG